MKIRHVVRGRCNPTNADGIITHTYHLAHAQLRLGHDVAVYGLESRAEEPELIDRDGLRVFAFPRTRGLFSLHDGLRDLLRTSDADVDLVHIQVPHDPAMYALSSKLVDLGIPYFVSPLAMWEPEALSRHRFRKQVYKLLFDDRMNRFAAGIHATGAAEVEAISRYAPHSPVYVVRNAIDLARIDATVPDPGFWQSRFDVPEGTRVFAFLGRLDPYQKGLDLLVEGWAAAAAAGVDARLALVGPPWRQGEQTVNDLISQYDATDSVLLTGPLYGAEKYQALRSATCYVQVSRYESTPFAVQEALACHLPAILSPGTTLAEVAEDYGAGWAVALDPEAIARRIEDVFFMSEEGLAEAGRSARKLVEDRHSLDRAAERIVAAYSSALEGTEFENDD